MIWSNLDSVCQIADRKFADFWPNVGQLLTSLKKLNCRSCRDFAKLRQPFANIWQFVHQKKHLHVQAITLIAAQPPICSIARFLSHAGAKALTGLAGSMSVHNVAILPLSQKWIDSLLKQTMQSVALILSGYRDCVNPLRNDHLSFLRHTFYDLCSGTSQTKGLGVHTDEYWDFNNETRVLDWIIILCVY